MTSDAIKQTWLLNGFTSLAPTDDSIAASPTPLSPPALDAQSVQPRLNPVGTALRQDPPVRPLTKQVKESTRSPSQMVSPIIQDGDEPRPSHVRILPTSLPYVHDQLMEQRDNEKLARAAKREESSNSADAESDAGDAKERTLEEQAATARALKPHSRSIVDLEKLHYDMPPAAFHAVPSQPKKSRKWQFGIRSRNQPYEAMLCLYKAIAAQGGVWEIEPAEPGTSCNLVFSFLFHLFFFLKKKKSIMGRAAKLVPDL